MALKLQSYKFVVIDFSFIYPKGTKQEDQEKLDPQYVKISGIAIDENNRQKICYIMDSFEELKIQKTKLFNLLSSRSVILGHGILKLDNSYNYRLELDAYCMGSTFWNLTLSTQEEKDGK